MPHVFQPLAGGYAYFTNGVINGAFGVGGTWSAYSTWTLPALTLGGTVTSNGQSFSGTIANLGTVTTADINGGTIDGVAFGGAAAVSLGTPSSGTLTSCTGLPVSTGIAGLGVGVATFLATPSSANLASAVTDETGSGALVFATSPSFTTPTINTAASVGGTWTAAAAWTLPAFTLGGTVTSNGQSFSGTIANLGTVTTADINGGTIDGAVIGGASAAAGTFTTLSASQVTISVSAGPTWDTSSYLWFESGFGTRYDGFQHRFDVGVSRTQAFTLSYTGAAAFASTVSGAFNGTIGATTPAAGAFTTLSATGSATLGDAAADTLNVGDGGIIKDGSGNTGFGGASPRASERVAVFGAHIATDSSKNLNVYTTDAVAADKGGGIGLGGETGQATTPYVYATVNGRKEGATAYAGYLQLCTTTGSSGVVAERARIDSLGNFGVGTATFGTSAAKVFSIATGTAPTTGVADTVQFYSSDDAAGHTIPSFYCEGANVIATGQADSASSVRVKMRINGTVVTLLAI